MQVDNREIPRFWYIDDSEDWELIDPPEYNLNEIKRQRNIYNEVHNLPQLQDDLPPNEHQSLDGHPQTISNLKGKKLVETEDDSDDEADERRAVSPFVVERFEQNGQRFGKKLL